MFGAGYFYWCGIVLNAIVAFWIVVWLYLAIRNKAEIRRNRKRYARKNIDTK